MKVDTDNIRDKRYINMADITEVRGETVCVCNAFVSCVLQRSATTGTSLGGATLYLVSFVTGKRTLTVETASESDQQAMLRGVESLRV